ncbi:MAG: TetR/AcrR family transcriptional regulator [Acidimicrobiia bacterium]
MPRPTPPDRLALLLDAAAAAFVEHGFQRTQMDDIAERLGVSKGTVYRSVDSKSALFAAVIACADRPEQITADALDRAGDAATVAGELAVELATAITGLDLAGIVIGRTRVRSTGFGDEVERVTAGLHRLLRSRRTAVMVLDRCAAEIPGLADVWFGDGRYALVDLWQQYLALRAKQLAIDVDHAVLARTIVEIITTWAVKIPWDPAPRPYPDDTAGASASIVRQLLAGTAR